MATEDPDEYPEVDDEFMAWMKQRLEEERQRPANVEDVDVGDYL